MKGPVVGVQAPARPRGCGWGRRRETSMGSLSDEDASGVTRPPPRQRGAVPTLEFVQLWTFCYAKEKHVFLFRGQ